MRHKNPSTHACFSLHALLLFLHIAPRVAGLCRQHQKLIASALYTRGASVRQPRTYVGVAGLSQKEKDA